VQKDTIFRIYIEKKQMRLPTTKKVRNVVIVVAETVNIQLEKLKKEKNTRTQAPYLLSTTKKVRNGNIQLEKLKKAKHSHTGPLDAHSHVCVKFFVTTVR